MRGFRKLLPIALAAITCSWAMAMSPVQAKREIAKVLHSITVAMQHQDVPAFSSSMAPDYTAVDQNGNKMTREQVLNSFKLLMHTLHNVKWDRNIETIKGSGNSFVTVTAGHLTAYIADQKGNKHFMVFDATSQDQWQKANGKWWNHGSKILKVHSTLDGRAVPMH